VVGRRAFYMLSTSPMGEMDVVAVALNSSAPPSSSRRPAYVDSLGTAPQRLHMFHLAPAADSFQVRALGSGVSLAVLVGFDGPSPSLAVPVAVRDRPGRSPGMFAPSPTLQVIVFRVRLPVALP